MFAPLSQHAKGLIITAMGVIAVSPDGLLTRLISADMITITFWRSLFYCLGMTILLAIYYKRKTLVVFLGIGLPGILIAVLYFVGTFSFIYSLTHTAVANTLFILSTTPLFAALISWLIYNEFVPRRTWMAIMTAAMGVLIICSGRGFMPTAYLGNLVGLGAAATLATSFTIISKNRDRELLPALAVGALMTMLVLVSFVSMSTASDVDLIYLFIMGFIMLPVASALMFVGPKFISASEVGLVMLIESLLGPLWVWIALGEHPGNQTLIGGTIVITTLTVHAYLGLKSHR